MLVIPPESAKPRLRNVRGSSPAARERWPPGVRGRAHVWEGRLNTSISEDSGDGNITRMDGGLGAPVSQTRTLRRRRVERFARSPPETSASDPRNAGALLGPGWRQMGRSAAGFECGATEDATRAPAGTRHHREGRPGAPRAARRRFPHAPPRTLRPWASSGGPRGLRLHPQASLPRVCASTSPSVKWEPVGARLSGGPRDPALRPLRGLARAAGLRFHGPERHKPEICPPTHRGR